MGPRASQDLGSPSPIMAPEITQIFQNLRLLFLRFFIAVRKINYFSCFIVGSRAAEIESSFIVYYEIKLRKNLLYLLSR